jgi:hypothetical protein
MWTRDAAPWLTTKVSGETSDRQALSAGVSRLQMRSTFSCAYEQHTNLPRAKSAFLDAVRDLAMWFKSL